VDDSAANNETVNDSLLLNLDFYLKLENAYRAKYPVVVADGQEDKNFRDI
jgi:hypothetical protein